MAARVQTIPVADGFAVLVTETNAGSSDEVGPINVPRRGTIVRVRSVLVSGSGTSISTEIGRAAGWASGDIDEVRPAGENEFDACPYFAPDDVIYLRSNVDAGADNMIRTEILIRAIGLAGG